MAPRAFRARLSAWPTSPKPVMSVAAVTPFYYAFTVAAVLSGLLVFAEVPNGLAVLGMALILCAGIGVIYADERLRQSATIS